MAFKTEQEWLKAISAAKDPRSKNELVQGYASWTATQSMDITASWLDKAPIGLDLADRKFISSYLLMRSRPEQVSEKLEFLKSFIGDLSDSLIGKFSIRDTFTTTGGKPIFMNIRPAKIRIKKNRKTLVARMTEKVQAAEAIKAEVNEIAALVAGSK